MGSKYAFILFLSSILAASVLADQSPGAASGEGMEKVTGIGGLFFRAKEPAALAKWYQEHLGVSPVPGTYEEAPWTQEAGPTVFAPFPQHSEYFGPSSQQWMVNFRVNDLEKMVSQLRSAGIEVTVDPEDYPNGKFARLSDPEGNPIQLWQPR